MVNRELEFRGINKEHLKMYFEELGGSPVEGHSPILFHGDRWSAEILSEKEIFFTSVFKVNAVQIRFTAENEDQLEDLIKQYRYKTTRIGG